jgi:sugar/nucleoside kinase (ribokinase family)
MFDVITFGSGTKDVFFEIKDDFTTDQENNICFSLGSKININKMKLASGGGGTNVAVGLAKQGFFVSYCGKIGNDSAGYQIIKELEKNKVDTRFVSVSSEKPTNYSVVLGVPNKDRTIFVYRGASGEHNRNDFPIRKLNARWFYIAPFSVKKSDLFYELIDYAELKSTRVMANPSKEQLKQEKMKDYLKKIDVLLLNKEEASILTGVFNEEDEVIFQKIKELSANLVIMTNGENEVVAIYKDNFYRASFNKVEAVCKTGAGDAFGSGFLSEFIRSSDIQKSLHFGAKNAASCVSKVGAKNGLISNL